MSVEPITRFEWCAMHRVNIVASIQNVISFQICCRYMVSKSNGECY